MAGESPRVEGEGGNREVPPQEFLVGDEASVEEEGGSWGKPGFPHATEPEAKEVETGRLAPDAVRTMFDRISPVYDAMNRTMTLGLDQRWRRAAAQAVVRPGDRVLDACCGTGDLALAAKAAGGSVTGLDFSGRMLERARGKSGEIEWVQGDTLALPFGDAAFDAATVGFGVRNLDDLERGLAELRRVLRPGARGLLAPFYRLWFDRLVPLLGRVLPGGSAYTYLPASVRRFPGPEELAELLRSAGFEDVRWRLYAGGIVALHIGKGA
jgi:demethylmenaquinone methyltransferase/2-methoxy-6-polyprenyl-1,4-benzoquinol methylase